MIKYINTLIAECSACKHLLIVKTKACCSVDFEPEDFVDLENFEGEDIEELPFLGIDTHSGLCDTYKTKFKNRKMKIL